MRPGRKNSRTGASLDLASTPLPGRGVCPKSNASSQCSFDPATRRYPSRSPCFQAIVVCDSAKSPLRIGCSSPPSRSALGASASNLGGLRGREKLQRINSEGIAEAGNRRRRHVVSPRLDALQMGQRQLCANRKRYLRPSSRVSQPTAVRSDAPDQRAIGRAIVEPRASVGVVGHGARFDGRPDPQLTQRGCIREPSARPYPQQTRAPEARQRFRGSRPKTWARGFRRGNDRT